MSLPLSIMFNHVSCDHLFFRYGINLLFLPYIFIFNLGYSRTPYSTSKRNLLIVKYY
jgi:uncharacterized membrane protein